MLKSHILCVLFTVCGLSFALATLSGEVAEILRRGGRFFPCMWQVQPGICKGFAVSSEENDLLPVELAGRRLCQVTSSGGVQHWREDIADERMSQALERDNGENFCGD